MMLKQNLINKIISNKFHFTVEKEDDGDVKQQETWFAFQTLEQHEDKFDEMGKWLNARFCGETSDYHNVTSWEEYEERMKERLVKKYGNQYLENII